MKADFDTDSFNRLIDKLEKKDIDKYLSKKLEKYGVFISEESIKNYRKGKAIPRNSVIYAFSKILKVDFLDFLEDMQNEKQAGENMKQKDVVFMEVLNNLNIWNMSNSQIDEFDKKYNQELTDYLDCSKDERDQMSSNEWKEAVNAIKINLNLLAGGRICTH